MKRTMMMLAVAGVALAATLSCQPCGDKVPLTVPAEPPEVQPANNLQLRGDSKTLISAIRVERGGSQELRVTNGMAYVLIPDSHLTVIVGETESSAVGGILAFTVDEKGATLQVPREYPASAGLDIVIHYSVLCFDQEGDAYYAERKSPPRIIIPPG